MVAFGNHATNSADAFVWADVQVPAVAPGFLAISRCAGASPPAALGA